MLFSNDTGILGKRNSEFSQQESNLRPSDYNVTYKLNANLQTVCFTCAVMKLSFAGTHIQRKSKWSDHSYTKLDLCFLPMRSLYSCRLQEAVVK